MMRAEYLLVPVTLHFVLFGLQFVSGVQFVEEPADVTKTFTNESVGTGYSFLLKCQVSSLESDQKVSWFKNGEIISDGYNFRDNVKGRLVDVTNGRYRIESNSTLFDFTLLIRSVSPISAEFDSGIYQCVVTWFNDVTVPDGRSRSADVNIYVIPTSNDTVCTVFDSTDLEVNSNPISVIVPSNPYTLTCLSSRSTPPVTLIWSRNDQTGPLSRSSHGENGDGLYYISHNWVPSGNDGSTLTFTCTLQHPGLPSDRTCFFNFSIKYAPIVTIDPTYAMVIEENDEIVLHCNQDANPQVTHIAWYYDDDVVNSGGRFSQEGMSLRILGFSPSDNGDHMITCELTNAIGTGSDSVTLTVDVQYAPIVTIDPTDVMVTEENDEIVLHCNQDANPQVTVPVWYYDDDVVNSGDRFTLEGMSLHIVGFSPKDNGNHTIICQLTNAIGTATDGVMLTVDIQYAPIVTIDPTDVMVTEENDEIVLHCKQDANPQVTETVWYYDDDVVNSGGRYALGGMSLRIVGFSPNDNGNHTVICQLTNAIGTGSDSVMLTVDVQYSSTKQPYSQRPKTELFSKMTPTATNDTHVTTMSQQDSVSVSAAVICPKASTNNIWLFFGLLCVGLIV